MYETEGRVSETLWTGLFDYLRGKPGPSGYGSSSTAAEVAKDWKGDGKVGPLVVHGQISSSRHLGHEDPCKQRNMHTGYALVIVPVACSTIYWLHCALSS